MIEEQHGGLVHLVMTLSPDKFVLSLSGRSFGDIYQFCSEFIDSGSPKTEKAIPASVKAELRQLLLELNETCEDTHVARYLCLSLLEGITMWLRMGYAIDTLTWTNTTDVRIRSAYVMAIALVSVAIEYGVIAGGAPVPLGGSVDTSTGTSDLNVSLNNVLGESVKGMVDIVDQHLNGIMNTVHIASSAGVGIGAVVSGALRKVAPSLIIMSAVGSVVGAAGAIQIGVLRGLMSRMDDSKFWDFLCLLLCRVPHQRKVGLLRSDDGAEKCLFLDYRLPIDPGWVGSASLKAKSAVDDYLEIVPVAKAVIDESTLPLAGLWLTVASLPKRMMGVSKDSLIKDGWVLYSRRSEFLEKLGFSKGFRLNAFCGVIDLPAEYKIAVRV